MSRNIYIYYEFYKREFLSNLLLSIIAAKKNFNVYIGSNNVFNILHKKRLLSPGIFHTKSLSHGTKKTNFHKELKIDKFIITSIDQEHGVIDKGSFDDLFIKPRVDIKDLSFCDTYFCWGKFDFKYLKKKFKKNLFYISGSPRVDLWKEKFDKLWKKKVIKKNYVLFVSNFSFTNNYYPFKEILQRKKLENYYLRSPNLKKEEIEYFKYQVKSMKKFTNLILNFSKKFPNEDIILRPHPTEKIEYWQNKFKNYENIKIKPEGDLSTYIRNAKLVVQDGCTSAMESYISNIPVINYIPVRSNKHSLGQFIKNMSLNIYSEEKFFKVFKSKKYKLLKNKKDLVNHRMIYLDKKLSSQKITDIWEKLFKKNNFLTTNISFLKNDNFKILIFLFFIQNFKSFLTTFILFFKRKMYLKKIFDHKNEKLDTFVIKEKVEQLKSILKIKNNFKISKLGKDLIFISLKNNN